MNDKIRLYVSIILTTPLLLPMLLMLFGIHFTVPIYIQFLFATIVQFYGGYHFYNITIRGITKGNMSMDTLIVIGSTAAWGFSTYLAFTQKDVEHALYYESSAVIISAILLGKYIEKKSKMKVSTSLAYLFKLIPNTAFVKINDVIISKDIEDITINDTVIVASGESIPIDGVIVRGEAYINETMVTGESNPVYKTVNDSVIGGTINNDGSLEIRVTKVGSNTMLANIIKLIRLAQFTKAPIESLADRISTIFVPIIIIISIVVFLTWWLIFNDAYTGLSAAITVLIITCPCALGLAVPTVLMVALSSAAKNGILIKNAEALQKAYKVNTVVFDKTGTLTEGNLQIEEIKIAQEFINEFTTNNILNIAASAMQSASHPISKSIVEFALKNGIELSTLLKYENKPGKGLLATLENHIVLIGSQKLLAEYDIEIPKILDNNYTVVHLALISSKNYNNAYLATIKLLDTVKSYSNLAIKNLNKMHIKSIILSGDNIDTVKNVAHKLDIKEYYAAMSPEDKVNKILELTDIKKDTLLTVGDGINDSPALANSYVSVAMGSGANVSIEVADIILANSNPNNIPALIYLSKATMAKIKQNLAWAFLYNIIAIPYAAFGMLNPIIAGVAMGLSSISVIINSMLLKKLVKKFNRIH